MGSFATMQNKSATEKNEFINLYQREKCTIVQTASLKMESLFNQWFINYSVFNFLQNIS